MKRTIALILSLILIMGLAACGGDAKPTDGAGTGENVTNPVLPSDSAESNAPDNTENSGNNGSNATLSDDLNDAQLMIAGELISVPNTFEYFLNAGWEPSKPEKLEQNNSSFSGGSVGFDKGDAYISLAFSNRTEGDLLTRDCVIDKISISAEYCEGAELLLPQGVTFGMSKDEVRAIYGEPNAETDGSLRYYLESVDEAHQSDNILIMEFSEYEGMNYVDIAKLDI